MAQDEADRNYDLMLTGQARLFYVQNDIMRSLHCRKISPEVRERMVAQLRTVADDFEKLATLDHQ